MPKKDAVQNALSIVEQVTGAPLKPHGGNLTLNSAATVSQSLDSAAIRRQIMQEMGRRGGKKGGKARAKSLSAAERKAIAVVAATKRWGKKRASK